MPINPVSFTTNCISLINTILQLLSRRVPFTDDKSCAGLQSFEQRQYHVKPHITWCLKSLSLLHRSQPSLWSSVAAFLLAALRLVTQAFPRDSGAALSPCSHAAGLARLSSQPCTCTTNRAVMGGSHGKLLPPAWESPFLPLPFPTLWSKILVDTIGPKNMHALNLTAQ